jgi:hypothetical protein
VKDIASNTSRGKAQLRRHNPVKITRSGEESGSKVHIASLVTLRQAPKKRFCLSTSWHMNSTARIILNTIPPSQLVIEVNMNGSAYEHIWARLPKVGRFENWEQANSFAVQLEWEHRQSSGNWRFRYIQSSPSRTLVDANIPCSLKRYVRAIIFPHWLFDVERNFSFSWWDQTPTSNARVVQVSYDYMTQIIHFGRQTKPARMMAPTPLSTSSIKFKMIQLGLHGKKRRYVNEAKSDPSGRRHQM